MIKAKRGKVKIDGTEVEIMAELVTLIFSIVETIMPKDKTFEENLESIVSDINYAKDKLKEFSTENKEKYTNKDIKELAKLIKEVEELKKTKPSMEGMKKMFFILEKIDKLKK